MKQWSNRSKKQRGTLVQKVGSRVTKAYMMGKSDDDGDSELPSFLNRAVTCLVTISQDRKESRQGLGTLRGNDLLEGA
jgi:hypothetical protein